jgi:hypothetical protein
MPKIAILAIFWKIMKDTSDLESKMRRPLEHHKVAPWIRNRGTSVYAACEMVYQHCHKLKENVCRPGDDQLSSNAESVTKISVCKLHSASYQGHAPLYLSPLTSKRAKWATTRPLHGCRFRPCETWVHHTWQVEWQPDAFWATCCFGPQNSEATKGPRERKIWYFYLDGSISLYTIIVIMETQGAQEHWKLVLGKKIQKERGSSNIIQRASS